MNTKKRRFEKIGRSFATLSIAAAFCSALLPETKFAFAAASPVSIEKRDKADDDFDQRFREARDLIDKEEWAKAAGKFNEIISKYPDNKSADAALYWLAFCHKKQKQFKDADAALDRLLKDFPASSWTDDARVMKLEIAAPLGKVFAASAGSPNSSLIPGIYTTAVTGGGNSKAAIASTVTPQAYEKLYGSAQVYTAAPSTKLDREDEIKLAAFQSLLSADRKRGIEVMGEVLKPDSKAGESLKLEVLRAVRRRGGGGGPRTDSLYSAQGLGTAATANAATANAAATQFVSLLRETLVKSFQNETNIKIRKEIIYTLAALKDEQSVNYLAGLYASEDNTELKKAIINGFGSSYWGLGGFYFAGAGGVTQTQSLTTGGAGGGSVVNNVQTQNAEFAKLLEIFRIEKNAELSSLALDNLQHFVGWEKNAKLADALTGIYDSEIGEDFKKSIIQNLGKMKQPQASRKLMDIARNDKSDKLKLEAIYALRNVNTPEALKYLEDLIK